MNMVEHHAEPHPGAPRKCSLEPVMRILQEGSKAAARQPHSAVADCQHLYVIQRQAIFNACLC